MYCYRCGAENKDENKFCYKCGVEMSHIHDDKTLHSNSLITKTRAIIIVTILFVCGIFGYFTYCQIAFHKNIAVGDVIQFGKYSNEPIAWKCYARKRNRRLLIAENIIERKPYHNNDNYVTWEKCFLRQWLNNDFYNQTFTWQDALKISTVCNINKNNPETGAYGGNVTNDKIFCLSVDEVKKFLPNKVSKLCIPTAHLLPTITKNKLFSTNPENFPWWLRTIRYKNNPSGNIHETASIVYDGEIFIHGLDMKHVIGVRPAMWINVRE